MTQNYQFQYVLLFISGTVGHIIKSLKESTCESWKNVLFHFKSSFCSQENQILECYIFKFHDVTKCLSIKQEIHFTE